MANTRVITHPKSGNILLENVVDGKRVRLSTSRKSSARLLAWYRKMAEEEFWKLYYEKFGDDLSNAVSFAEYGNTIVNITKGNRNSFSQKNEIGKLNKLCSFFGEIPMDRIKPSHIQEWQSQLLEIRTPKTIREYRSTLHMIFEFAVDDEIIKRNPMRRIKPPKMIRQEVIVFDENERQSLISNAEGQLKNILQFAFFSGLRAGEITGLKWENIDFDKNKINVINRMRKGEEALPKGDKIRVIDLLPQAKEALLKQRNKKVLSKYVFVSKDNKPYYSETCITVSIKALCKKLGIKEGGLQVIRRSHNTMLKQLGLPTDWILHQMGHYEDKVNRDHYTGQITVDINKLVDIA